MGLMSDIQSLIGDVAASLPDAAHRLSFNDFEVVALQASAVEFVDAVSDDAPAETMRCVVSSAGGMSGLEPGAAVSFDGGFRTVTSLKSDPVGASLTVGLSASYESLTIGVKGRRVGGAVDTSVPALMTENGVTKAYSGSFAPSYASGFTVAVRVEDWTERWPPEIGDAMECAPGGSFRSLKVSAVAAKGGYYVMTCRARD